MILGGLSQIAGLVISFGESSSAVRMLPFRRYPNPFLFLGGADIGKEILTILVEVKQSLRLHIEGASFLLLDPRGFSQLDEKRLKTVQSFHPNMLHEHNAMDVCPDRRDRDALERSAD